VDAARRPHRGTYTEVRKWWAGEFRREFGGVAISGGRAAGQFKQLATYLGDPADVQRFLEFVLARWPEIQARWNIIGCPDPGFLLGWKHRIVRAMQNGDIPVLAALEAAGEAVDWE
jgi:hypothetical protein